MEYDEFEDLDLRATAAAGLGYYWIKKPRHEFKTRVGVGYLHESYDSSGDSENDMVLDLGWDYLVDIMKWAEFEHHGLYSPNVDDFADHRVDLDTALLLPLDSKKYWKLKLGMRNEYNSKPQDDLEDWDHTYYAEYRS